MVSVTQKCEGGRRWSSPRAAGGLMLMHIYEPWRNEGDHNPQVVGSNPDGIAMEVSLFKFPPVSRIAGTSWVPSGQETDVTLL